MVTWKIHFNAYNQEAIKHSTDTVSKSSHFMNLNDQEMKDILFSSYKTL